MPPTVPIAIEVELADEAATAALARSLARLARGRDVVALSGELGTGKTVFARAFIEALSEAPEEVPSPTFTLVQTYEAAPAPVHHFDLFRLAGPEETLELGVEEAFAEGISLIEWPDRLGPYLPAERLEVGLAFAGDEGARHATLRGHGDWERRLREAGLG